MKKRTEEIINYAKSFKGKMVDNEELKELVRLGIIDGAMWADSNPDEQMIAKYLSEKKNYPIDLNGNIPSFDETMKDVKQAYNYKKDKFIERACKYISQHQCEYIDLDDFKNYIKG